MWGATDQWIWRIVTARIPANASLARIRLLVDPSTGTTLTEMSVDRVCVIVGDMPADVVEQTPSTASTVRASRLLTVQPARRLFDKALLEVGTRPLIGVGLGASTWEGSSADPNRQLSVLIEKMLQASYNPPGITGGYTTKVRNSVAWAKTGSTSGIDDTDMKKIQVLNTNATATHQSWQDCTGIDIYYPSGSGIGAWTISIEGGAPVTVTPGSTESYVGVWRSPVLARGKHTFVITATGDNAQIANAYIRDQDEKAGVRLLNFGRAGGGTSSFLDSIADSTWARINSIVPDFAVVSLGPTTWAPLPAVSCRPISAPSAIACRRRQAGRSGSRSSCSTPPMCGGRSTRRRQRRSRRADRTSARCTASVSTSSTTPLTLRRRVTSSPTICT